MKRFVAVLLVCGMAGWAAQAQELTINLSGNPAGPKPATTNSEDRTSSAQLTRGELELSTQARVLNDLADEHLKRSEEAAKKEAPEKARWEAERAQELRERSTTLLAQLNEITKQRLASQAGHNGVSAADSTSGALDDNKAANPDELVYLIRLDETLVKTRQEILTLIEGTKLLHTELQTNNTVETMTRISALVDQNERQQRQLQREQSDLELRKLEFRALRKQR